MIKGLIHQEDIAILNVNEPEHRASKYIWKQKKVELTIEIDKFTIIVGAFNTIFSIIDRTIRKSAGIEENSTSPVTNMIDLTTQYSPLCSLYTSQALGSATVS